MSNLLLTIPTSSQGGNNGRPRLRVPRLPRPLQSSSLHQPVRPLLSTCSTTARHYSSICMRSSGAVHARPVRTVYTKCGENSARFEPEFSSHLMFTGFFRLGTCQTCTCSCTPTCTCSTPTCALRVRHYINLYDERYAPYGLKTTEKIHEFWLKNQPA